MKQFIIILSTVLFCLNYSLVFAQQNDEEEKLESTINAYYTQMSERNWPSYKEYFTEKAILTTIWQDSTANEPQLYIHTISEFLEQTQYGPDSQPIFEERPLEIEIQVKNNLASVWVLYTAKFGSEENLLEWTGWDLFSMIRHQDQWLITSITFLGEE